MQEMQHPSRIQSPDVSKKESSLRPLKWLKRKSLRLGRGNSSKSQDDASVWSQSYSIATNQTLNSIAPSTNFHTSISTTKTSETTLQKKLVEMDRFMEQDQILEARKKLDEIVLIENSNPLNPKITETLHLRRMQEVKEQSDYVRYFLNLFNEEEGWVFASQRRDITIHSKQEPDSAIYSTRTHAIFDNFTSTDFIRILSLFEECDLVPKWFPRGMMKYNTCLCDVSKYSKIVHFELSFPKFTLLQNRDAVMEAKGYHLIDENAIIVISRSIKDSVHCPVPSPANKVTRADILYVVMIEFLPGHRVIYRNLDRIDLKFKYVPHFITNLLSRGVFPFETISAMQNCLKKFDGSAWQARIKKKREFYTEVEHRVFDEAQQKHRYLSQNGNNMIDFYSEPLEDNIVKENQRVVYQHCPISRYGWKRCLSAILLISFGVFIAPFVSEPKIAFEKFVGSSHMQQYLSLSSQWINDSKLALNHKMKYLKARAEARSRSRKFARSKSEKIVTERLIKEQQCATDKESEATFTPFTNEVPNS